MATRDSRLLSTRFEQWQPGMTSLVAVGWVLEYFKGKKVCGRIKFDGTGTLGPRFRLSDFVNSDIEWVRIVFVCSDGVVVFEQE